MRLWDGHEQRIFRWSSVSALCYEVAWDFVGLAQDTGITFSKFVAHMSRIYASNDPQSRPFLAENSFIGAWFAWASCQSLEFRQPCSSCGWEPTILACDGTQLGIPANKLAIEDISKPASSIVAIQPEMDSRAQRAILGTADFASNKSARETRAQLRLFTEALLGKGKRKDTHGVPNPEDILPQLPSALQGLFGDMIRHKMSADAQLAVAQVFHLFTFDSSVSAFLPSVLASQMVFGCLDDLMSMLPIIRRHNIALADLIEKLHMEPSDCQLHACQVVQYLVGRVRELCAKAIQPEPAHPIPGSYNPPETGRFFYFSPGGEQIRRTRLFAKDARGAANSMYDEMPAGTYCRKHYGKVKSSAPAYIMFFFCPTHGHCYGGHIIDGKEGRKDPSCALYTHMQNAPKILFYDFACSLEEYNLNRESGFWHGTRLYHDIFHGYSHVCSSVFKLNKVLHGLEGLNTSICEQFNAYIKRIKPSAEHMGQQKFVFYVQYYIHLWNRDKAANRCEIQRKAALASVPCP